MKQISWRMAVTMAGNLVRIGSQFVVAIAASQYLGYRDFGLFAACLALARFVAPLVELGARVLYYRTESSVVEAGYGSELVASRLLAAAASVPLIAGVAALALPLGFVDAVLISTVIVPTVLLAMSRAFLLRADRIVSAAALDIARALTGLAPLLLIVAPSLQMGADRLRTWAAVHAIAAGVFLLGNLWHLAAEFGVRPVLHLGHSLRELRAGLSIALALVAQAGSAFVDQFLLGAFGDPEDVAVYSLAAASALATIAPLTAINELLMPRMLGAVPSERLVARYRRAIVVGAAVAAMAMYPFWAVVDQVIGVSRSSLVGRSWQRCWFSATCRERLGFRP